MADEQPAETVTATIRRLQAKVEADRLAATTDTPTPQEPTVAAAPTPLEAAQAAGLVSSREAGTFVLVDGLPALLVQAREVIDVGDGSTLDVWTVTRFTRQGPETIDRHGFWDGAA